MTDAKGQLWDVGSFPDPGLYLLLPDGGRLVLTRKAIEAATRAALDDPTTIPPHVLAAADFSPCDICPERDTAEICHAIMTTLPFLADVDRYMSYDHVTAVYREDATESLMVTETTMQHALQFITILSLTHYCEVGHQYDCYFKGVNPLMPLPGIARTVFLNIYLASQGDIDRVANTIKEMTENLLHTSRCQTKRISLISKRDAFLNAFVNTELITHFVWNELDVHIASLADA